MTATYLNGTSGDVTFNSIAMQIFEWKAKSEASELDTSSVLDGGFHNCIKGKRKCTGSFSAYLDTTVHTLTTAPIKDGQSASLSLALTSTTPAFSGTALLYSTEYEHSEDAVVKITCSFTYQGAYKIPGEP